MQKWCLFLMIAAVSTMAFITEVLPIGSKLPEADLKMKDISGNEMTMKSIAKKNGLLVMFSSNGCPYVIKNEQRTLTIAEYALRNNIGVVLLNSNEAQRNEDDSFEAMKNYAKSLQYRWPYLLDENSVVANAFDAKRTPEVFLFNRDLTLVYHGAIDDNPADELAVTRQHLREAINEMVNEKSITVKETKGIGCIIMRKKKG
ncbi:MAG: thioredoxin family protein [Ferruginibacter sp.]|nr:thioredoxin family protein [Ferruginibacter sp.]